MEEDINVLCTEEYYFWDLFEKVRKLNNYDVFSEWFVKFRLHLEKLETFNRKHKLKKINNLSMHLTNDISMRFLSRLDSFRFRDQLQRVTSDFFPDQEILINLVTLNDNIDELRTSLCGESMDLSGANILNGEGRQSSVALPGSTSILIQDNGGGRFWTPSQIIN